jgi:hypothetical protein
MKRYKVMLFLGKRYFEFGMVAPSHQIAQARTFRRFGIKKSDRNWMFGTSEMKR